MVEENHGSHHSANIVKGSDRAHVPLIWVTKTLHSLTVFVIHFFPIQRQTQ